MRRIAVWMVVAIGFLLGRETFAATQLITNGGFEGVSSAPWQPGLALSTIPIVNIPTNANTGNNYLNLGNVGGIVSERVFQTVTIPTNTLLAQYTFFWASTSSDPANTVAFTPYILNTNQVVLINPGTAFNGNSAYQQASLNLTGLAGQTVEIAYQVDALNAGIGVQSSFRIDDVSLLVFTADDIPANDNFTNAIVLTTSTNISVLSTNILATKEPGEPKHAGNNGGHSVWWKWTAPGNGVVTINTINSTFNTLLGVYTGGSVSNLTQVAANDDNSSRGDGSSQVHISVLAGTEYEIAVDGKNSATGVIQLNLSFSPDIKAPTVSITSPKSGAKLTNSTVNIQGKASDNLNVALVQFRLENAQGTNDYQNATGTNSWTGTVTGLIPGPNTIRVRAVDISGNESTASSTVTYVVVSPISVTSTGTGTFSPNLNGQLLDVGATYKITAKPGAGQVFANWTGTITNTSAALTFIMQSNMVLQANFVPNPFTPVVGAYQGLFYDTNSPEHQSSGFFSATVASSGSFSAKMLLAGKSVSLSGQFSAAGFASNNIIIKGAAPVSVQLQLDLQGGGISGVLSNGLWTAQLFADRPASSPVAQVGKYTLLIPGADNGVGHPGGDSYGTVTVSTKAGITFAGVLADGTKVSQKANVLANGQWPFYVSLYSGNGSIFGWLTFSNGVSSDITGRVDWFKLSQASAKFYPAGFTNETDNTAGSSYVFTKGTPVLNFPGGGPFTLSNGNLANSFTSQIALDSASKVTSTNSTLKMTITTTSGLFKGSIANPEGGKAITFNGVVLQKQNFGGGFFLGTSQSGRVFFGP
ncbi:MAG TPA: Ig-like domain-containing protein [Verrucomicrobiae bacterium]|nr:Ig-like domain-containing protein [Verrucomicrobiae bacterium]